MCCRISHQQSLYQRLHPPLVVQMAAKRESIKRPDLAERFEWPPPKAQALFSAVEAPSADAVLQKYARQQSRCRSMVTRALNSCERQRQAGHFADSVCHCPVRLIPFLRGDRPTLSRWLTVIAAPRHVFDAMFVHVLVAPLSLAAPLLQFLTKSIEDRKCELSKPVALCIPMPDAKVEAAYHVGRRQVVVNSLVVSTQQDAIRLLLHELTHAYDACRVYLDPSDCRHAACTEVCFADCCGIAQHGCCLAVFLIRVHGRASVTALHDACDGTT
jgi:hypothetical protein